ncbi:hypothetical protein ACFFGH_28395 [Lysobacter korlensis]|uniref:Uncharacterized protein n=1 Tax=Lysobacter korlensis TaxID=553636 RepID=A0ABV6RXR2_9GAMM
MATRFTVGTVAIDVLDGEHPFKGVPTSQWHGNRQEIEGQAVIANLQADDGLRAQVALVEWPGGTEWSLRMSDLLAGPGDYDRLRDAGELAPKAVGNKLVARLRALRYKDGGRAGLDAVGWEQLDGWAGGDARALLEELGASRTGAYVDLLPDAPRFKTEPAVEVPVDNPAALFAVYGLTRVMPLMLGHGRAGVEAIH